jgi:hypothetical protein
MSTRASTRRSAAPGAKLYVIPTHPCRTSMLMLEHKGIPYRPVALQAPLHPLAASMTGLTVYWHSPIGWAPCPRSSITASG